jgi:hypothetical protein
VRSTVFRDTGGVYYDREKNTIFVQVAAKSAPALPPPSLSHTGLRSDTSLATAIVHEAEHARRYNEHLTANINDPKPKFVSDEIDEEVEATLKQFDAANAFVAMGYSVDDLLLLNTYNTAFRKATLGKYPELSTAERDAIGREAGRAAV